MTEFAFLALDGCSAGAVGITIDVVDAAHRIAARKLFKLRFIGVAESAAMRGGLTLRTDRLPRQRSADVVLVPGLGASNEAELDAMFERADVRRAVSWLASPARAERVFASSCSGAFLLGAAGLLDGQSCTTTWWLSPLLQQKFPRARVRVESMVAVSGRVVTAGASLAHMDLMLTLLARLHSQQLAHDVGQALVVDRRVSQARYIVPSHLVSDSRLIQELDATIRDRLAKPLSLEDLASDLGVTGRTLSRRTRAATGESPMRFVQRVRVQTAVQMLETTKDPVERIARKVGLASPSSLYRLVMKHTGKSPLGHRVREIS
jgi:transcriptional regulator GlxA family with amidase domain